MELITQLSNDADRLVVVLSWVIGIGMAAFLVAGWCDRARKAWAYRRDPELGYSWRRAWRRAGEA